MALPIFYPALQIVEKLPCGEPLEEKRTLYTRDPWLKLSYMVQRTPQEVAPLTISLVLSIV
jgi:hypothetical protein